MTCATRIFVLYLTYVRTRARKSAATNVGHCHTLGLRSRVRVCAGVFACVCVGVHEYVIVHFSVFQFRHAGTYGAHTNTYKHISASLHTGVRLQFGWRRRRRVGPVVCSNATERTENSNRKITNIHGSSVGLPDVFFIGDAGIFFRNFRTEQILL